MQLLIQLYKEPGGRRTLRRLIVDCNKADSCRCVQERLRRNKQMPCWEPDDYPLNRSSHTVSKPACMQEIKIVWLSGNRIKTEQLLLMMLVNVWTLWSFLRTQCLSSLALKTTNLRPFILVKLKLQIGSGICGDLHAHSQVTLEGRSSRRTHASTTWGFACRLKDDGMNSWCYLSMLED